MSIQELQKYTAISKYAKYLKNKKRRETWSETCERWKEMMKVKYPHRSDEIERITKEYIYTDKVMPAMRTLQFGGKPIFDKNERVYNCTSSYVDRLSFFSQFFFLLLCGSGVGASLQERHLQHLPVFSKERLSGKSLPKKQFVIPDTIEGWAETSSVQLTSYHSIPVPGYEDYLNCDVEFIYDKIRPEGSELSSGVGRAPGAKPLAKALAKTKLLLNRCIEEGNTKLSSIFAYDYCMHTADAVRSGGIRRSATIMLFDWFDLLMLNAKVGDWYTTNPQRGRSNNSAYLKRGDITFEQFCELFKYTMEFGEPGFYWTDNLDVVPNPCVEIGNYPKLIIEKDDSRLKELLTNYDGPIYQESNNRIGLSGFQFCNLVTQSGKKIKTPEDFYKTCEVAATIGTWQAGFTNFPFMGRITEEIVREEALLGVSICGVMHNPEVLLNPEVLQNGVKIVKNTNDKESNLININPSARNCCIKPDGNSASKLGSFSGSGGGKIRRGFRISQTGHLEAPYQYFKSINPEACERSAWDSSGKDECIRFCVEYEGKLESEMTAVEYLGHVKTLQENWVIPGTNKERCVDEGICHNVSNTVRVKSTEWDDVKKYIYENKEFFGGVSFISDSGDRDYVQAPYTPVFLPAEIEYNYGTLIRYDCEVLLDKIKFEPSYKLWNWCDSVRGIAPEVKDDQFYEFKKWFEAMQSLYLDKNNIVLCLKDCYNLRLWTKLRNSYKEVDYSQMIEEYNTVDFNGESACAGGACEN